MGVDPGEKRVGIALSDEDGAIASPHTTLAVKSNDDAAARIAALVVEHAPIAEIVIGLPIEARGTEGLAAKRARALADRVARATSLRVVLWDERATSQEASRALSAMGLSSREQRGKVDRVAAAVLLQSYLDARAARRARRREAAKTTSPETTAWDADQRPPAEPAAPSGRRRGADE